MSGGVRGLVQGVMGWRGGACQGVGTWGDGM